MPTSWFLVPMLIHAPEPEDLTEYRYCALRDESVIDWTGKECMGNQAICRVTAAQAELDDLATRFNLVTSNLDAPIAADERPALRQIALDAGYTEAQVAGAESSILTYRDWFGGMLTYRRKPRLVAGEIAVDGELVPAGELPE